ncbi:hypothetical protein JAAARDRAFT_193628 [Jaapia argillacea MUCL 33604]|uniref:F-box domain-containing protein n=1 Tax=Jaapia argillacea MUCL 33604 TaxID=933084 RepID=A0A067Q6G3_9AGAM|nr:hypothetical protein JAAARDRAFT_193628 [Jaapia argillacea MUCL 33604]
MSFLTTRRRSRVVSQTDSATIHSRSTSISAETSTPSTKDKKSHNFVNRVATMFSPRKSDKNQKPTYKTRGNGIVNYAPRGTCPPIPFQPWNISSDSQEYEPSLTIRRPSGLGPPADSPTSSRSSSPFEGQVLYRHSFALPLASSPTEEPQEEEEEEETPLDKQRAELRPRCISSPSQVLLQPSHRRVASAGFRQQQLAFPTRPPPPRIIPIPSEIIPLVVAVLPRTSLPTVARVSRPFQTAANQALYASVDLTGLSREKSRMCLRSLIENERLAGEVRSFTCPFKDEMEETLYRVLKRLSRLRELSLSSWSSYVWVPRHRFPFQLTSLSLLESALCKEDQNTLLGFLSSQTQIRSLSLPNLVLSCPPSACPKFPSLNELTVTSTLFPILRPSISSLHSLTLHVVKTLYDGLRPAELMVDARSLEVRHLGVVFGANMDKRTVEKVLGAVGKETGSTIEELMVKWDGLGDNNEALYKQVSSLLPRLTSLQTLQLQTSPAILQKPSLSLIPPSSYTSPPSPTSPALSPTTPSSALSLSPAPSRATSFTASISSASSSPFSTPAKRPIRRKPVPSLNDPPSPPEPEPEPDVRHGRERAILSSWSKYCPTLSNVTFTSGAHWNLSLTIAGCSSLGRRGKVKGRWLFVGMRKAN